MILRNYASSSIRVLMPADNRPQTTDHSSLEVQNLFNSVTDDKADNQKNKKPEGKDSFRL